jgi:hypothetical protein
LQCLARAHIIPEAVGNIAKKCHLGGWRYLCGGEVDERV